MLLKRLLICILITISISACVSQTDYEKVNAEKEALAKQLEEEQFGADKLLNAAKAFLNDYNYTEAEAKLNVLLSKHADKKEAIEAKSLLQIIGEKKKVAAEEYSWESAKNSEELSRTEQYINSYPSGRFIKGAKQRLKILKEKQKESAYQYALTANSSSLWKQFLENYPNHPEATSIHKRIIRAEVDEIMNNDHGTLPAFSTDYNYDGSGSSTVTITNQTEYVLSIRYSGPDAKMIAIPASETRSVTLISGDYKIAASVNASNVRNFFGNETLNGKYSSKFYIFSSSY